MRLLSILLGSAWLAIAAGDPRVEQARKLYNLTEFEKSLAVLRAIDEKTGPVFELMGRNFYMQSEYKSATEALEKALAAEPGNSSYALWLGRAYGRRAESSSVFTAPGHATKARQYFERAVQLDSANLEALNDLLEYYLEAPGMLGGGLDKAQATAAKIAKVNAAEGYWAQAKIAEKRKEFSSAEQQLRRAIEASPRQIGRFVDLARLLTRQGRFQEAEQSFETAEKISPNNPGLMYAKADLYIKQGKNLSLARELLKRYISADLTPDDPPRSDAVRLLKQVQGS